MKSSFPSWKFSLVPKRINEAADWVAGQSRMLACPCNWINHPPLGLAQILNKDGFPASPRD
ncbi:hypothetical protein SLEP1_g36318 [Rubroshorea leprosula]|uniref:RNase H type-1 domain-containing protein n=1 Tax=Rubroshorea leprosula TaxID=152421 RepID=A0AAV5KRM5_9ROSI|nr:hypothetical protein SLEP1_g36318 [Rubroshorea leprosula]